MKLRAVQCCFYVLPVLLFAADVAPAQPVTTGTVAGRWVVHYLISEFVMTFGSDAIYVTSQDSSEPGGFAPVDTLHVVSRLQRGEYLYLLIAGDGDKLPQVIRLGPGGRGRLWMYVIPLKGSDTPAGHSTLAAFNDDSAGISKRIFHTLYPWDQMARMNAQKPARLMTRSDYLMFIKKMYELSRHCISLQATDPDAAGIAQYRMTDILMVDFLAALGYSPNTCGQVALAEKKYAGDKRVKAVLRQMKTLAPAKIDKRAIRQ